MRQRVLTHVILGPTATHHFLAGLAHYAVSRSSIIPSVSRRTLNRNAVVASGVDRGSVGFDNGISDICPRTREGGFLAVRLAGTPKKLLG